MITIKAVGDWELDILGVPFGGPNDGRDAQGEYFSTDTKFHEDKFGLPPLVYYHGYDEAGRPSGEPEYIGKAVRRWIDERGVWFRGVLDKAKAGAQRVWEAAQQGVARASSGSAAHLTRRDPGGHIREWPVVELSLIDTDARRQPANAYAVALPATKAIYAQAGLTLPDAIEAEPGATDPGAGDAQSDAGKPSDETTIKSASDDAQGDDEMDPKEVQQIVADALKADRDAREAEAKAQADVQAKIDEAVKDALAKKEEEDAKDRRLPGGFDVPYVMKYPNAVKFDNLEPGVHALVIDMGLGFAAKGYSAARPSEAAIKALFAKIEGEAGKDNSATPEVLAGIKALGLKANDINYSTYSSYGDEWVGILYSAALWEKIRAETWVVSQLAPYSFQVPDGYESATFPLEYTDPTWYRVAQATAHTSGRPDVTVIASKFGTANKSITLAKMGCRAGWSGELNEVSLVRIAPQLMMQMQVSGAEQMELAIIDGDTDETASTNINDIAGTPAGTETFLLVDGFRKLPLITNTANSRSGGALTEDDYLDTAKMLGTAGINADVTRVGFIVDMPTYWASLKLSVVKTEDVWSNATLASGQLQGIYGFPLRRSAFMHAGDTDRLANSDGKVDLDVTANNTTGSILAVRWDQWRMAIKRRMTIETDRDPQSDTNELIAMARWGLGYRDTEASAISYGITGV